MKLLILTQKVDRDDPVLGFFHRWLEEFAGHFDFVTIICLQQGNYNLPKNIKVLSLGKEKGVSRLKYLYRFYKYIWQERKNYDAVFVHMNPEYIVLGGWLWKLCKTKVCLWYVHRKANWKLKISPLFINKFFTVSKNSFPLKTKNIIYVGHCIDVEAFKSQSEWQKIKNSILYVGRLSPVKNIEKIINSLIVLDKMGVNFRADFVGSFSDEKYRNEILYSAEALVKKGTVHFLPAVANYDLPSVYNKYEVLANLTTTGSYDKVILEAMSAGIGVLSPNYDLKDLLGSMFLENLLPQDVANKINNFFVLSSAEKEKRGAEFRKFVVEKNNLKIGIGKIVNVFKSNEDEKVF